MTPAHVPPRVVLSALSRIVGAADLAHDPVSLIAVSLLAIRRRLIRLRGSLAAIACVMALGGGIVAHHTEMPGGHVGMDMHGVVTMVMCLGVLGLAAVALAALPKLAHLLPGMSRPRASKLPELVLPSSGARPTRAGPPLFLVLAVVRR